MIPQNPTALDYAPGHTTLEIAGDMLCSGCFQPPSPGAALKRCSSCYRVSYCSTACQKQDWKRRHKQFCPRFQEVNKYDLEVVEKASGFGLAVLVAHQDERVAILTSVNPAQHEPCEGCAREIFKHEVVCEVCYKTPYQSKPIKPFESCSKCQLARYCSEECKAKLSTVHSEKKCEMLALLHATERTDIDYRLARKRPKNLGSIMTPSPRKRARYVPMSSYTGWDQYYREFDRELKAGGITVLSAMYGALVRSFKTHSPKAIAGVSQLSTESASFPFTILFGLDKAVPNISTYTSLEIHVVGAASRELGSCGMAEEILHQLPRLKNLNVRFVGPEAFVPARPSDNSACPDCQAVGGRRTWSIHTELYHEYVQRNPHNKPDIIVCLNSGFLSNMYSTWPLTLRKILDMNIPALFTEYSREEAIAEVGSLRFKMGARFVVDLEENRWRGVIPIINRTALMNHGDVLYSNQFVYVVNGRI